MLNRVREYTLKSSLLSIANSIQIVYILGGGMHLEARREEPSVDGLRRVDAVQRPLRSP